MNEVDRAYMDIVDSVLDAGHVHQNRTGVDTLSIPSATFYMDLEKGSPFLHLKKVHERSVIAELCGFLQGQTDKEWYRNHGCTIWDEWCSSDRVPYGNDEETKARMLAENDLGPIGYAAGLRRFGAFTAAKAVEDGASLHTLKNSSFDQWSWLVSTLEAVAEKEGAHSDARRMVVSYWNPLEIPHMALPPCHYSWQVIVQDYRLHLIWNQRSVDVFLGLPFNIAHYGLLCTLLARHVGLTPGTITGNLGDTHIYANHQEQTDMLLARRDADKTPRDRTSIVLAGAFDIMQPDPDHIRLADYSPLSAIKAPIAV